MAVLSNTEIIRALDEERLVIEPRPMPEPGGGGDTPYDTVSVDLRLAAEIRVPSHDENSGIAFAPDEKSNRSTTLKKLYRAETISPGYPRKLKPGEFILGSTMERIALPVAANCLAARIDGRSSLARQGLIMHFTAPTIHTGFNGAITLGMINWGKLPIMLSPGMRICQLIMETVEGMPSTDKVSQFQNQ